MLVGESGWKLTPIRLTRYLTRHQRIVYFRPLSEFLGQQVAMMPRPIYDGKGVDPAYCLRYSWTGWPSGPRFENLPEVGFLDTILPSWERDGLRLLEHHWSTEKIQLTFSTKPSVSPEFLARRAKGRLRDALRKAGNPQQFSRKLSVRSVGNNTTENVLKYIENQVGKESFVDPAFAEKMLAFTVIDPQIDLSVANVSLKGRYWYNMHVVLVVEERLRTLDFDRLATVRDGSFKIAKRKGYLISGLSVMLDHLHIVMRGDQSSSPQATALAFQNNLAFLLGQQRVWSETFYVGTFTEYDMGAIRAQRLSCST